MSPSAIIEQRDLIQHLQRHGFGDLLAAMADARFFPRRGAGAGKFSLTQYARSRRMHWQKARAQLQQLRSMASLAMA